MSLVRRNGRKTSRSKQGEKETTETARPATGVGAMCGPQTQAWHDEAEDSGESQELDMS